MTLPMIPSPNGATRVFATIGDPVFQVQAPHLMNEVFARAGSNAVMVPFQISARAVNGLIESLKAVGNFDGLLATIPHKFDVPAHADNVSAIAEAAGCANALRREQDGGWTAENFDGIGFVTGMIDAGYSVAGRVVSIYGTGGAGSSIAAALLDVGAASLRVFDVIPLRAEELCDRLERRWQGRATVGSVSSHLDADIVVNATPMGLSETDPLPFKLDGLNPDAVVAEIVMKPVETRLLKEARARGFRTQSGFGMLAPQIELYRKFFRIPDAAGPSGLIEAISQGRLRQ
ncbi:shikimate dehydrogenase [Corticibacterium sp. UT-5YL-CI-8]|nr:shikimate dehydrogenase [Tianweitania sp. UT-5YL-CI-8]